MSGEQPSTPLTPRPGQREHQSVEQVDPVAHGERAGAAAAPPAGRVVRGDHHEPAVVAQQRGGRGASVVRPRRDGRGPVAPGCRPGRGTDGHPRTASRLCFSDLGFDLGGGGHARRSRQAEDATIAPARVAEPHVCARDPIQREGVAQAPPNASPAPSPLHDLDGHRGTSRGSAVVREDAAGTLLDDASSTPALVQGPRRAYGSRIADMRSRTRRGCRPRRRRSGSALLHVLARVLAGGPEHRAVVQVQDGVVRGPPGRAGGQRRLAARLLGQARDGDPEDLRPAYRVPGPARSRRSACRGGGGGRSTAGSRRAGRYSQKVTGVGRSATGVTNRSSTPKPAQGVRAGTRRRGRRPVRVITALRRPSRPPTRRDDWPGCRRRNFAEGSPRTAATCPPARIECPPPCVRW
jgi:hypothetical protein